MGIKNLSHAPLARPHAQVCCCIHLEERAQFPNSHKGNVSSSGGPAHGTFMKVKHILDLKEQMTTNFK